MAGRGFDAALDECLAALQRGESLESCLSRYPKHAQQLRALLSLGQHIRRLPRSAPSSAASAAAWRRLRLRAQELRQARTQGVGSLWLRSLAVAASLFLAVIIAGGATVFAAQDSLPDSPLYRVKLASEEARLWFVLDETEKGDILLDQSDERTEEIIALLQKGKPVPGRVLSALRDRNARVVEILADHPDEVALSARAQEQSAAQEELLLALWEDISPGAQSDYSQTVAAVHNTQLRIGGSLTTAVSADDLAGGVLNISGKAERSAEGLWRFGGVEVRVDERTLGGEALEPGQTAKVVAARGPNGRLQALNVVTAEASAPGERTIVAGSIDELAKGEVQVAGQTITITRNTLLRLKLKPGKRVEITVSNVGGRAVASTVKSAPIDQEEEGLPFLTYEGTIEDEARTSGETNEWTVGGRRFVITSTTEIDARGGQVKRGSRARLEAVSQDGKLRATRVIILETRDGDDSVNIEGLFQGVVVGNWRVGGLEIVPPQAEAPPAVGSVVRVEGRWEDDRLEGEKVILLVSPDGDQLVRLQGVISQIATDSWQLGIAQVQVDEDTLIIGDPEEGARALVWARQSGGRLQAAYINVLDDGSPNPQPQED